MKRPRRKPRRCRQCGKPLRTSTTGRWFFCEPPGDKEEMSCQAKYVDEHEPDVDPAHLLELVPTDEDDDGTVNPSAPVEEPA